MLDFLGEVFRLFKNYLDFFLNRVDKMIVELYNLFRKISK